MPAESAVGADRAHPADAQQHLLQQPVLAAAAVEAVGDVAFGGGVLLGVGVQHQQRHPPDLGLPDPGVQPTAAGQRQRDHAGAAVRLAHLGDGELVRVEQRVALLLPAVAGERLAEVAVAVEQADADDRRAQVTGGLEVVPGQDAEAAGVLRQGGGDAELGREVGDRGRSPVRPPAEAGAAQARAVHGRADRARAVRPGAGVVRGLVPARPFEVVVQVVGRVVQAAQEPPVCGQRRQPLRADRAQQADRVAAGALPDLRIDLAEQLACLRMPGPAQI